MNILFFTIGFIIWLGLTFFTLFFAWKIGDDSFENFFIKITLIETILWLVGTVLTLGINK